MKHLTVDEIISFVSLTELNSDAIELSATVNGHIRKCEQCLKHVRAFQMIYDEFSKLNMDCDLKTFILDNVSENKLENENLTQLDLGLDSFS